MNNLIPSFTPKTSRSVCIAYVHGGSVQNEFMVSLINLMTHDQTTDKYFHSLIHVGGIYIPQNRHLVVEQFMKTTAEWLFFIDSDMVFPPDSLKKMVEVADPVTAPIIGGLYFGFIGKNYKVVPVWLAPDKDDEFATLATVNDEILTPLSAAGTGSLIIHRSVLERLQQTYAHDCWPWFSHDAGNVKDGILEHFGEDVTFCVRARACGFPVYGYAGLIMEHKKHKLIGVNDYLFQYHLEAELAKPQV